MASVLRAEIESRVKSFGGERPPWKAKTVWAALALVVLGGGLWIQNRAPADNAPGAAQSGGSQFSDSAATGKPSGGRRELQPSTPATFRFGASYVAGFFLGWTLRRFLKLALLLSGAAMVLIALGRQFGWFELDWEAVEGHVRHSLAWLQGEAGAFKKFVSGYLPSAGAAGVGAFLGFRRK
jgi:uncharacterized membrane protein (Fun14 family)